jgi:hypothetical protein
MGQGGFLPRRLAVTWRDTTKDDANRESFGEGRKRTCWHGVLFFRVIELSFGISDAPTDVVVVLFPPTNVIQVSLLTDKYTSSSIQLTVEEMLLGREGNDHDGSSSTRLLCGANEGKSSTVREFCGGTNQQRSGAGFLATEGKTIVVIEPSIPLRRQARRASVRTC